MPDEWINNEEKDQYFNTIKQSKQDNITDIEALRRKNNSALQMKKKTLSQLREKRKKMMKPDISYDIDGDGGVSQLDYFIAKRFDSNNDGILDSHEKIACLNALKSGYQNNFIFGIER